MNSFINIQVIFNKPYELNLLRENLIWQQLSTVIQTSIIDAADKEPLSLYFSLNSEINTLSNDDEFSQLLLNNDILGLRHYGQSQKNMEPVHILPLTNEAFKKLSELVQHHDLESDLHLSKMAGILAARIAYSPHKNFDDNLILLENTVKDSHSKSKYRKLMKSRKMLWKYRHHRKLHKKMTHRRKHASNNDEVFEFLSHHPSKEQGLHRLGRREFHHHPHHHHPSKYTESDASLNSLSDFESKNKQDECGHFGRRGSCDDKFGRHGYHSFGPIQLYSRFGKVSRHGRGHGRHNFGSFGGPGFSGSKSGGEFKRRHHHDRRGDLDYSSFEPMNRQFGSRGHHHGRNHEGKEVFLFV